MSTKEFENLVVSNVDFLKPFAFINSDLNTPIGDSFFLWTKGRKIGEILLERLIALYLPKV